MHHTKWLVLLAAGTTTILGWSAPLAAAKPFENVRLTDGCTAPPEITQFYLDQGNQEYPQLAVNLPWVKQFVLFIRGNSLGLTVALFDDSGTDSGVFTNLMPREDGTNPVVGHRGASWWQPGLRHEYARVQSACGSDEAQLVFEYQPDSSLEPPFDQVFVAAGDSYSSGEGNPPFVDQLNGGSCHLGLMNWPTLMFTTSPFLEANVACSGARIADLFRSYRGQPSQLQRLKELQPDLVTLTIGGNDINWSGVLAKCFALSCSRLGVLSRAALTISKLWEPLVSAYKRLQAAVPGARVIVVGYPRLFPLYQSQTVNCGWLEPAERNGLNKLAAQLDSTEQAAAATARVEFVSTLNALTGHELCTRDSWVIPLFKIGAADEGHPTVYGQKAIADIVRGYITG